MTGKFATPVLSTTRRLIFSLVAVAGWLASSTPDAVAQGSRYNGGYITDDFGPAPDDVNYGVARPFEPNRGFEERNYDVGRSSTRSRDPARTRPRNYSRELGLPVAPESQDWGTPRNNVDRDWNSNYAPQTRPFNLDDLPLPNGSDRNRPTQMRPAQPRPLPTTPARPATVAEPTLSEKLQQRYSDPKVVRVLQQMSPANGEALYAEVSQYIDQRHITPTSYQQRVEKGLEHLAMAVQTPNFQQALGIRPNAQAIRSAQQGFQDLAYRAQVQNLGQAVGVMRQADQMMSQMLQVNPGAASLEFVYGALATLDKFSMFIAPEKSGEPMAGLQESMVGIGVEIESHPQGLKILKAISGGPAAAVTLQRGDIITAIDGQQVAGMSLNQAVDLIAGPSGSPVKLDIRRDNMIGDVTIVRRPFQVHSVAEVRMESDTVGYIKLDQFAESSAKELDDALWSLHNQGMQSLIFDLRGNPGGLLTTAIEISDRFLPSGTIVSTRGRTVNDNSQEVAQQPNTWKVPLVVLVDHNSASASEIFAAAIQENGRGLLVGEKSYGKGTVQTLFPLKSVPSALRLTTAKFYSPDGREMAGAGVTPDIKVTTTEDRDGYDAALAAALKAATDPRLIDMAEQVAKLGKAALRVIKVAI